MIFYSSTGNCKVFDICKNYPISQIRMKRIFIKITLWGIIVSGCSNHETINEYYQQTVRVNSAKSYSFTIYKDMKSSDNSSVIYYLHGSGGDHNSWINSHKKIINEFRLKHKPSPVIIGISFGNRWLLTPEYPGKNKSGFLEYFIEKVIPDIEKQLEYPVKQRYVMGISMGALSAAQLIFRFPELFDKGIIITPPIYPFSIYSEKDVIDSFIHNENFRLPGLKRWFSSNILRRDVLHNTVYTNIMIFKSFYFPDQEAWEKGDILKNIIKPRFNKKIPVYISCGLYEENGFYPGAELLTFKASEQSYSVKWRSLNGGHMAIDETEIADFLME